MLINKFHRYTLLSLSLFQTVTFSVSSVCTNHQEGQERQLSLTYSLTCVTRQQPLFPLSLPCCPSTVPPNEVKERKLAVHCMGPIDSVIKVAWYRVAHTHSQGPAFLCLLLRWLFTLVDREACGPVVGSRGDTPVSSSPGWMTISSRERLWTAIHVHLRLGEREQFYCH